MGFDQVLLQSGEVFTLPGSKRKRPLKIAETEKEIRITGWGFSYTYDKLTGMFSEMNKGDNNILKKPMQWNIWRAPTDNDRNVKRAWRDAGYDRMIARAYDTEVQEGEEGAVLITTVSLTAVALRSIVRAEVKWDIKNDGRIKLSVSARLNDNEPYTDMPHLPRFGIRLFLSPDYKKVKYYGYGPNESYIDKHIASYVGLFETTVKELFEDYVIPQENGSHCGCKYLCLSDSEHSIEAAGEDFSFNASEYTEEELTEKRHNFELKKSGYTVLCLDYKQAGIGTNSCGPALPERDMIEKKFNWEITIKL